MANGNGDNAFGDFVGVYDVDECIIDLYKTWAQTYLNEVARRSGEPFARMKAPRNYRASHEIEFMPEDQRPCVVIVCATPDETPYITASNTPTEFGKIVTMAWQYDIAVQVVAQGSKKASIPRAHRLAMLYATALRLAVVQAETELTKKLGWFVDWRGEEPGVLESDADRTTCVGIVHLTITCPAAMVRGAGPLAPEDTPADESPEFPVVETTGLTITKWPTEEPFPGGE
jgi:hypothetical protein